MHRTSFNAPKTTLHGSIAPISQVRKLRPERSGHLPKVTQPELALEPKPQGPSRESTQGRTAGGRGGCWTESPLLCTLAPMELGQSPEFQGQPVLAGGEGREKASFPGLLLSSKHISRPDSAPISQCQHPATSWALLGQHLWLSSWGKLRTGELPPQELPGQYEIAIRGPRL